MKKLFFVLAFLFVAGLRSASAQTGNSACLAYLDPGASFGGPLQATSTGWNWSLVIACREPATNRKIFGIEAVIPTLDADTLAQIAQKLANGVKAAAAPYGYNVTTVLLPSFSVVTPQ